MIILIFNNIVSFIIEHWETTIYYYGKLGGYNKCVEKKNIQTSISKSMNGQRHFQISIRFTKQV